MLELVARQCRTLSLRVEKDVAWMDARESQLREDVEPDGSIDYFKPVNDGGIAPLAVTPATRGRPYTGGRKPKSDGSRRPGEHGPQDVLSPKPSLAPNERSRLAPELLSEAQEPPTRPTLRASQRRYSAGVEERTVVTAPWCTKGGSAPSLSLVQQASRLSVDSQRAPRGTRASLSKGWKKFFADSWGGLCQGVCACPLSAVERPGGGRQGAEFDHRDGDPSNGHITNFQLLCLTCHEAKTAIQRAEECVPVPDPEAWRAYAVYNPVNGITEYPERFKD